MSRYIDADALISKAITRFFNEDYFSAIITIIDNMPTADVVEVVHGEWINNCCSVCGYEPYNPSGMEKFNYCSNCGADMKGGSNDGR